MTAIVRTKVDEKKRRLLIFATKPPGAPASPRVAAPVHAHRSPGPPVARRPERGGRGGLRTGPPLGGGDITALAIPPVAIAPHASSRPPPPPPTPRSRRIAMPARPCW